jgi:hypothetical protein
MFLPKLKIIKENTKFLKDILIKAFNSKRFSTDSCVKQNMAIKINETPENLNISIQKNDYLQTQKSSVLFFDFQSTTPIDPRVLDAMLPYLTYQYGNPHSKSHELGWNAEKAVEAARNVLY